MSTLQDIQSLLGVKPDGVWGDLSHTALLQAVKEGRQIQLSRNFYLDELINSNTATRLNIDNTPSKLEFLHLLESVENLWQPFRDILGTPMLISSGLRTPKLNDAVGGAMTSAHLFGYAIDFTSPAYGNPRAIVNLVRKYKSSLKFDQCIYEYGRWVHLAYKNKYGRQDKSIFDIT